MKTIALTDDELDILYNIIEAKLWGTDSINDAKYRHLIKNIYKRIIDVQQAKSSDDNPVPHYCVNGGEVERLTEEESKELGGFLHSIISDYLDFNLIDVTDEVKQQAIRQANTYKRIYNKLIKPIYKVEE